MKGERCGCEGGFPNSRMKAMKVVVAVQNAAAQNTHGDRLVSNSVCLGKTTLRGSPPPTVPRQHQLAHAPPTFMERSISWTYVWFGELISVLSDGALVLCIKPTSSLPVLQVPILNCEINFGLGPRGTKNKPAKNRFFFSFLDLDGRAEPLPPSPTPFRSFRFSELTSQADTGTGSAASI